MVAGPCRLEADLPLTGAARHGCADDPFPRVVDPAPLGVRAPVSLVTSRSLRASRALSSPRVLVRSAKLIAGAWRISAATHAATRRSDGAAFRTMRAWRRSMSISASAA